VTREEKRALALECFRRLDAREDLRELLDARASVHFPKWGIARGAEEIGRLFDDVRGLYPEFRHHAEYANFVIGEHLVVVEGVSSGALSSGERWRAAGRLTGRWSAVLDLREGRIDRLFMYLDPDAAAQDTSRYAWLQAPADNRGGAVS
jgi:hypothetical protein